MASRENYFADIDDKFFVDPSNFQGHQYSQYKNYLMSVALTTPSEYYKLQTDVIEQLNVKIAKFIYKQLFLSDIQKPFIMCFANIGKYANIWFDYFL